MVNAGVTDFRNYCKISRRMTVDPDDYGFESESGSEMDEMDES